MSQTIIAPEGFEGQDAVELPKPAKLPRIDGTGTTKSGTWLMNFHTAVTIPAPKEKR